MPCFCPPIWVPWQTTLGCPVHEELCWELSLCAGPCGVISAVELDQSSSILLVTWLKIWSSPFWKYYLAIVGRKNTHYPCSLWSFPGSQLNKVILKHSHGSTRKQSYASHHSMWCVYASVKLFLVFLPIDFLKYWLLTFHNFLHSSLKEIPFNNLFKHEIRTENIYVALDQVSPLLSSQWTMVVAA